MRFRRSRTAVIVLLAPIVGAIACGGGSRQPATTPEPTATHHMRMARSMMTAGRVGEALESIDEAIRAEPENPGVHQFRGEICMSGGLMQEAEEAFLRALELDPFLTEAHTYLGAVYQETGRVDLAEESYKNALDNAAYPTPEKAYLGLGLLYDKLGRGEEAEQALRRAVGVNPRYYTAHFHLAELLARMGSLREAAREYEEAEPAFRQDGEYWYRRGLTYYRMGAKPQAADSLRRVRDVAPGSESSALADELLDMLGG